MKIWTIPLSLLLWLAMAHTCSADMTVKQYLETTPEIRGVYVTGVGSGFSWANDWLKGHKFPLMFCIPDQLPINGSDYIRMVDRQIEQLRPKPGGSSFDFDNRMFIGLLLQHALIEAFPCRQK
jgi:hypothetical protein